MLGRRRDHQHLAARHVGAGVGDPEAVDKQRPLRVDELDGIAKVGLHVVDELLLRGGKVLLRVLTGDHRSRRQLGIARIHRSIVSDAGLLAVLEVGHELLAHALDEGHVGVEKHVRAVVGNGPRGKLRHVDDRGGLNVHERLGLLAGNVGGVDNREVASGELLHALSARGAITQRPVLPGQIGVTGKQTHADSFPCKGLKVWKARGKRRLPLGRDQKVPARAPGPSPCRRGRLTCGPTLPLAPPR